MDKYKIIRIFNNGAKKVIATDMLLEEARDYCLSPLASSRTNGTYFGRSVTMKNGPWWDVMEKE
jgi:hypothetical protein